MSDNEKKGFSGFGDLLSDVDPDDILKDVPSEPVIAPISEDSSVKSGDGKKEKLFGPKAKWLFGGIGILILIGILSEENSSTSTYTPTSTYNSSSYQPTSQQTENSYTSSPSTDIAPQNNPPIEDVIIPQPGTNQTSASPADTPVSIGPRAASFDCSEAKSTLEILICSDPELSILDGQVGEAYLQAKNAVSAEPEAGTILLNQQREFLKGRLEVCKIPFQSTLTESDSRTIINCLKAQYGDRLKILEGQIASIQKATGVEDLSPTTKNNIASGVQHFFDTIKETGIAGVTSFLNSCYNSGQKLAENELIYCISFDAVASAVIPAMEEKNNYPKTPEYENSVYQARVRKSLSEFGITDPYEQGNVITGIEGEASHAVDVIIRASEGSNHAE